MKFIVNGACGRMGHEVIKQLSEDELAARVDAFSEEDGVIRDINEYNGRADGCLLYTSGIIGLGKRKTGAAIRILLLSTGNKKDAMRFCCGN